MSQAARTMKGRPVVAGSAAGEAVVSAQPISLWGGLDARTGEVIDRRHDCSGRVVTGRVFNCATDPIAALGSIIADELYEKPVPIVVLGEEDYRSIRDGDRLSISPDGTVTVENSSPTRSQDPEELDKKA